MHLSQPLTHTTDYRLLIDAELQKLGLVLLYPLAQITAE